MFYPFGILCQILFGLGLVNSFFFRLALHTLRYSTPKGNGATHNKSAKTVSRRIQITFGDVFCRGQQLNKRLTSNSSLAQKKGHQSSTEPETEQTFTSREAKKR